jgi:glycosyltransferase involved in cell wall biosynthesis
MRPVLARASLVICPLLEGGGTRLKILDAMAMGRSVVSTTIGCEGLRVKHGENILVADDPHEFGERVMQLLQDERLRAQMGNAARNLVEQEYGWDKIGEQLLQAYRGALPTETSDPRCATSVE